MVFYGTETEPNSGGRMPLGENKPRISPNLGEDSGQLPEPGNNIDGGPRGEKDPRHERQRTTTEGSHATGCGSTSSVSALCIECYPGFFLYNGQCIPTCPPKYFPDSERLCSPCHYTCLSCNGSSEADCLTCYPDADIHQSGESRASSFCFPRKLAMEDYVARWYYYLTLAFFVNMFILLSIIIFFCSVKCGSGKKEKLYSSLNTDLKKELEEMTYDSESDDDGIEPF